MSDPTTADLVGCRIAGYAVVGWSQSFGEVVLGGQIFGTAEEARREADSFQYVTALVCLPEEDAR
jgi:hypothetical protein